MVTSAFKEGAEKLDHFFKERMMSVSLRVSDLSLVYIIEGLHDVVCVLIGHLLLHGEHGVDNDCLEQELIGTDGLAVVLHLSQHSQGHLGTISGFLMQTGRKEHVDVSHTVNAVLSEGILTDLNILHADSIDLNGALWRIRLQVVRLDKELVVLGGHWVVVTEVGCDLRLSLEEKLLTLLLVLLDKLSFAEGSDNFSSNVVPLILSSNNLLDHFASVRGKLTWSVFGIVDLLVFRIMLHQVHSSKFKLVFDDAQDLASLRSTHFLKSLNDKGEAFFCLIKIETLNEKLT